MGRTEFSSPRASVDSKIALLLSGVDSQVDTSLGEQSQLIEKNVIFFPPVLNMIPKPEVIKEGKTEYLSVGVHI